MGPCIKIEIHMPLDELVRLHDVLRDDLRHDSRAQFVATMIEKKLEAVARAYEASLLAPNDHELALWRAGDKMQAIKALRERTQAASLVDVKNALERVAGKAFS